MSAFFCGFHWFGSQTRPLVGAGLPAKAALRALAFKWIRIVYQCWKTSTVYDEKAYLQALTRRGSTLVEAPMEVVTG
jgi:hypothetical protein